MSQTHEYTKTDTKKGKHPLRQRGTESEKDKSIYKHTESDTQRHQRRQENIPSDAKANREREKTFKHTESDTLT